MSPQASAPKKTLSSLGSSPRSSRGFPGGSGGKEPTCQCRRDKVQSLGREDPLEEGMAPTQFPAWRIPWTEEPCRLQSVGHKESDTTEAT